MKTKFIQVLFLFLVLADLTYSFRQHYSMPLDGDMAGGIVPSDEVKPILKDPFGFSVVTNNAVYANPNRFFAHLTFFAYFNTIPLWLQRFFDPIDSVYISCAASKILIQILILALLSVYSIGSSKLFHSDTLIAAILITPFFQTNGFRSYIGIIDPSITYTFFYALPCALLLIFFLPFYYDIFLGRRFLSKRIVQFFLLIFLPIVVFNGALNPGIILTISLVFTLNRVLLTDKRDNLYQRIRIVLKEIPSVQIFFLSLASLLSMYALFLGSNNSIFQGETISLAERYQRIPAGIVTILTQKIGFPIFLIGIGLNIFLLRRNVDGLEVRKTLNFFKWIAIFAFIYISLLPFGGYKEYRFHILRYDTIMPITLALIFIYTRSSYQIIRSFSGVWKYSYIAFLTLMAFIFLNADRPEFSKNRCERAGLTEIAESNEAVVFLEGDCHILSWNIITDPTNSSLNGVLLKRWGITQDAKQYFQKN